MESETLGEGPAISVIVSTEDWRFHIVVLGKTLGSTLDCDKIKPVNANGNQPWIFIGRTDAEALILWSPDAKSWLFGEDPDCGKGWRQTEKGAAKHEIVRWPHRLNRHELDQTPGDSRGQRSTEYSRHDFTTEQQQQGSLADSDARYSLRTSGVDTSCSAESKGMTNDGMARQCFIREAAKSSFFLCPCNSGKRKLITDCYKQCD